MRQPVQTRIHKIKEDIARGIERLRFFTLELNYCRGYENILNILLYFGQVIRSLCEILGDNPNETIRQKLNNIETLIKEAKDVVSDSIGNPAGRYKAINRLVDLKDKFEDLSDILTEFQQTTSIGKTDLPNEKPAGTEQNTICAKIKAGFWKLYEKTVKAFFDSVLEKWGYK